MNRRQFLIGTAALGATLGTGGCAGTYDIGAGLTGSSGGAGNSTLVYWNLLSGGDGTHMQEMEAAYTKTHPAGIGTVVSGVGIVNALQMASAVLGALPLIFVFLLAQRQIVEGVAGTGLK